MLKVYLKYNLGIFLMTKKIDASDLVSGQNYKYQGKVEFVGDIPPAVSIIVQNGDAVFKGSLGRNVDVQTQFSGLSENKVTIFASARGIGITSSMVTLSGNTGRKIIVNGKDVTEQFEESAGSGAIVIEGHVANFCTLEAAASISISQKTANDVTLIAKNSISISDVGRNLQAQSGNSFKFVKIDAKARIKAGNSIKGEFLGVESQANAGNSVKIKTVANSCIVTAGNKIEGLCSGQGVLLQAGNKVKIKEQNKSIGSDAEKTQTSKRSSEVIKRFVTGIKKDFKR